jgi:hypothetical protein
MADEISEILDAYNANTLKEMAEVAGLDITRNGKKLPKAQLITKLQSDFFTAKRIQASLARLTERERAVLNRLLLRGEKTSTRSFKREVIRAGLATEGEAPKKDRNYYYYRSEMPYAEGYIGYPNRPTSTVFEDIIAHLTYHGLVFSQGGAALGGTTYKLRYHPAATLYIPKIIRKHLPEPEALPATPTDWQPVHIYSGDPTLFLRDLYLYWDFVRRNEVALLQTGLVGKRSLKAINDTLLQPDPLVDTARREDETERLYLLRQMLEALGLLRQAQGQLRVGGKDSLAIPPFWSKLQVEQITACLNAWPQLTGFRELTNQEAGQYGARFTTARQLVLSLLKSMPANLWLEAEELLEQAWEQNRDFLLPDHSSLERAGPYSSYYYSRFSNNYFYGKPEELLATFEKLETKFLKSCLEEVLYSFGIVELGSMTAEAENGQPKNWQAFRLTVLGRAVLGQGRAPDSSTLSGKLIIQPNFQIMAIGPVGLDLLAQLDLFADRERADRGVFQYRLSRESVYRAQQLGFAVSEIIPFLSQASEVELPQNVRRSLEEWRSHHERITFRSGVSLLQAATPELLEKLLDEATSDKLVARPVAPDVALVKKKHQEKLVPRLIEQGLLPAISGANPEAADQSVLIEADGTIQPVHAVPSLHLRGRLAQIAEERETGAWHLTQASVRRAGGNRNKVNQLLAELRKLQRGLLPESLVIQIKTWGGYYGQAAAETLTLIEFSDPVTLEELAQHPDLRPYLTPFPAGNRVLAIVPTEDLAKVKDRLAGFGVEVKDSLSV